MSRAPEVDQSSTDEPPTDEPTDWELGIPALVPAGIATIPAAGGVTFELDRAYFVLQDRTFFAIPVGESNGDLGGMVGIEIHELIPKGAPITEAQDVLDVIESQATLTALNESLDIDGRSFEGYRIEAGSVGSGTRTGTQFSSARPGGPEQLFWFPGPTAVIYLSNAEGGGVTVFGYEGPDAESLAQARQIFDDVIQGLTFG